MAVIAMLMAVTMMVVDNNTARWKTTIIHTMLAMRIDEANSDDTG